jgi:hypothetical protein
MQTTINILLLLGLAFSIYYNICLDRCKASNKQVNEYLKKLYEEIQKL